MNYAVENYLCMPLAVFPDTVTRTLTVHWPGVRSESIVNHSDLSDLRVPVRTRSWMSLSRQSHITNPFLSIMDEARLRLHNGKKHMAWYNASADPRQHVWCRRFAHGPTYLAEVNLTVYEYPYCKSYYEVTMHVIVYSIGYSCDVTFHDKTLIRLYA